MRSKIKKEARYRRHKKVRAKISGTSEVPRLCVFKSSQHIYAQLIDDGKGKTLAEASDLKLKFKKPEKKDESTSSADAPMRRKERKGKAAIAFEVGKLIAKKALKKKIEKVVFDRGGYKYHGRVKALAEGARSAGLKF